MSFGTILASAIALTVSSACSSCAMFQQPGRSATEQHRADVEITTRCTIGESTRVFKGSGAVVGEHQVLTAAHVAHCPQAVVDGEVEESAMQILVNPGDGRQHEAQLDLVLPGSDVARLTVADSLEAWLTPISLGPKPVFGDRVCEAAAWPRQTYRCGLVQLARADGDENGDLRVDMYVEFGNSGSGVYDTHGRLVGIMVMLSTCQDGARCNGYVSSLWPRKYLLE